MTTVRRLTSIALVLVLVAFACDDPERDASFEAGDTDALPDCMADQFPFEPNLLAARTRDNRTGIFLQTTPDVNYGNDIVYFQLYDTEAVETNASIELSPDAGTDSTARGKIAFLTSCPDFDQTLTLTGTLQFDSFEPHPGGIIDGNFTGRALQARSREVLIDDLVGSWRFVVRQGPPYQDFYGLSDRR